MKNLEKQFKLNKNCSDELLLILKESKKLSNRRNKFFQKQHEINGYLKIISNQFDDYNFLIQNPSYFKKDEFENGVIDSYLVIKQMLNLIDNKLDPLWSDVHIRYYRGKVKELKLEKQRY